MKLIVIITAALLLAPYRDKSQSRTVSIPILHQAAPVQAAAPVTRAGGAQLFANDCVPAAFARAAGIPLSVLYAKINELYQARALDNVPQEVYDYSPSAYPFDVLRMTPVNAIRAMNALGYSVTHTEANPALLPSIPRGSVFTTPGWGHAYNIVSYTATTLTAFSGTHNETFVLADYAVMRRVGQPTENRPDELHYPDVYIIR